MIKTKLDFRSFLIGHLIQNTKVETLYMYSFFFAFKKLIIQFSEADLFSVDQVVPAPLTVL